MKSMVGNAIWNWMTHYLKCELILGALLALAISIVAAQAETLALTVANARAEINLEGRPSLRLTLSKEAQELFGRFTTRHTGRMIEVRLHGRVLMKARLRTPILGREFLVGDSFSFEEAKEFANQLSSGDDKIEVEVLAQSPLLPNIRKVVVKGFDYFNLTACEA